MKLAFLSNQSSENYFISGRLKLAISLVLLCVFTLSLQGFAGVPGDPDRSTYSNKDIRVSGKVTNAAGEALRGVTIIIQGSGTGTSTGAGGEYSLSVPDSAVLVFSYVGYETQEVAINGQTTINVILRAVTKSLEQVIVVGYGTQRKKDVTGSISSISGDEITKEPVLTATQAIQGKVAGVQIISSGSPNSAPIVRIRGTGSILAGVNPLYVVDGVFTDDIRNINSADILSLEVLKDASSAAIYGVRAANGVILITTKRGRAGKIAVSYNAVVGFREASHLVKMANADEYLNYINTAGMGVVTVGNPTNTSTDWFGTILRRAFHQDHNISISGAGEKTNYYFSAGYYNEQGIVINNKFDRFTLRSNNEYRLTSKLKVNTIASYSLGNTQDVNLGSAYNNAYHAAPVIPDKVNGRFGNTSSFQSVGNPLLDIESNNNKYRENRLQATGIVELKPISWLTLRTSYGVELAFNNRKIYVPQYLNDTVTFITAGGSQKSETSNLTITNERGNRWVWDNTITLQKSFNKHDFTLLAGTTSETIFTESISGTRVDVPADPNLWYFSAGDPASQTNSSAAGKNNRNSYLARLNYSYDRKYLLTATIRADGSSSFLEHWGYFPSVGLGWNVTREGFMKDQKIFNNLKLRASWGKLGNDRIPSNARFQTLQIGLPYFFGGNLNSGSAFRDIVDKDVKWESTEETDLGLEFTILKNKLSGELDFYKKKVDNALISIPISGLLGDPNNEIITNVASIENKGFELLLNWRDNVGQNFSYSISANLSHNKNNVLELNGGKAIFAGDVNTRGTTTYTNNGQPIASFYLLQADGVIHNATELAAYTTAAGQPIKIDGLIPIVGDLKYKDLDGDGNIDPVGRGDKLFSGAYQPKYTAGLTVGISYKAIDFSSNLYGSFGSKIYNGKKAARFNDFDNVEASVANESWTITNPGSDVPRPNLDALPNSTYYLEKGDFVRINNLTIGYTLNLKKYNVSSFRFYITAQNAATFTKYTGFTPELSESNPLNQGIEYNAYPTTRTYALGVNLTF